jgi:hypothetical protein
MYRAPLEERFWNKVQKTDGCWLWTGYKKDTGYGLIYSGDLSGKQERAHRISWILHNGPIPDNLHVLHKCDNPSCVRPDHLFLGTHQENMDDRERKKRRKPARGEKHGCSKLTTNDVIRIRELGKQKVKQRDIGKIFNISQAVVWRILHRTLWTHVP